MHRSTWALLCCLLMMPCKHVRFCFAPTLHVSKVSRHMLCRVLDVESLIGKTKGAAFSGGSHRSCLQKGVDVARVHQTAFPWVQIRKSNQTEWVYRGRVRFDNLNKKRVFFRGVQHISRPHSPRLFQTRSNQPRILWGGAVVDPFYQNKKEQLGVAIVQESRNGVLTKRTSLDRQSFRPPCRQARSFKRRKVPTCSSTCLLEMIRVHQNGQMHPLFDMSDDRRLFRNLVHQT